MSALDRHNGGRALHRAARARASSSAVVSLTISIVPHSCSSSLCGDDGPSHLTSRRLELPWMVSGSIDTLSTVTDETPRTTWPVDVVVEPTVVMDTGPRNECVPDAPTARLRWSPDLLLMVETACSCEHALGSRRHHKHVTSHPIQSVTSLNMTSQQSHDVDGNRACAQRGCSGSGRTSSIWARLCFGQCDDSVACVLQRYGTIGAMSRAQFGLPVHPNGSTHIILYQHPWLCWFGVDVDMCSAHADTLRRQCVV